MVKSLKGRILMLVALSVVMIISSLSFASYKIGSSKIAELVQREYSDATYRAGKQLEEYVKLQVEFAKTYASDDVIEKALQSEDYYAANRFLNNIFKKAGIYENVFLSTPQKKSQILAGQGVGVVWSGIGYDDNIAAALNGDTHISKPGKSPVSGLGVILITVPVIRNGEVKAIFGLPLDLGAVANRIVSSLTPGKSGIIMIVDQNGLVFSHPDKTKIFNLDISKTNYGPEILAAKDGDMVHYSSEDEEKIATIYDSKYLHLRILAIGNESDISDELYMMALTVFALGGLGIVILILFVHVFLSRGLHPLDIASRWSTRLHPVICQ